MWHKIERKGNKLLLQAKGWFLILWLSINKTMYSLVNNLIDFNFIAHIYGQYDDAT